jgi:hypothetical protein
MATVKFKPNEPAPSDAEKTVYNVFVNTAFTGYIALDWMGYWWYYVNGKNQGDGHCDRHSLFALIEKKVG